MKQHNKTEFSTFHHTMAKYYNKDPRLESFVESYLINEDLRSFLNDTKKTFKRAYGATKKAVGQAYSDTTDSVKKFDSEHLGLKDMYEKIVKDPVQGIYDIYQTAMYDPVNFRAMEVCNSLVQFMYNTGKMFFGMPSPTFLVQGLGAKAAVGIGNVFINAAANKNLRELMTSLYYLKKEYGLSLPKISSKKSRQENLKACREFIDDAKAVVGKDLEARRNLARVVMAFRKTTRAVARVIKPKVTKKTKRPEYTYSYEDDVVATAPFTKTSQATPSKPVPRKNATKKQARKIIRATAAKKTRRAPNVSSRGVER